MAEIGPPIMVEYQLLSRLIANATCWSKRQNYWRIRPSPVDGGRSRSVATGTVQRLISRGWAKADYMVAARTTWLDVTGAGRAAFEAIEPINRPLAWKSSQRGSVGVVEENVGC